MTQTMPKRPAPMQMKLEKCCLETLEQIRDKHQVGKYLQGLLTSSPFLLIFASHPIDAALTVTTTDFDLLGRSILSVPNIVRNRCQYLCGVELMRHKGGDLYRFWREMYNAFSPKRLAPGR
ncbi:MAG: hypothetical protein RL885_31640 [Planctomycetota bacterium]